MGTLIIKLIKAANIAKHIGTLLSPRVFAVTNYPMMGITGQCIAFY